jgi:DNA-binding transcriptional LysR family regulator
MTRRQIAYFLSVAECESFSRAAERLHVAQSALSARIGELERMLGCSLFERRSHGVTLTGAGRALLPHAREIELAFERAVKAVTVPDVTSRLSIQLGVTPSIGATFLPVLLEAGSGINPEADWQVQQTISVRLIDMLGQGEIDAAICYLRVVSPLLHVSKLYGENLALIGARSVLGSDESDIPFTELASLSFVLDPKINPRRHLVDAAMLRTGIELQMHAEIEPLSVKKVLVRDRGLCAILPRYLFAAELAQGTCVARCIVTPRLPLTLYLLYRKALDGQLRSYIQASIARAMLQMGKTKPSQVLSSAGKRRGDLHGAEDSGAGRARSARVDRRGQ